MLNHAVEGLNPFFIRSVIPSDDWGVAQIEKWDSLNPFFIRSVIPSVRKYERIDDDTAKVLVSIPSSSGQ
jgi:hypothetical protein